MHSLLLPLLFALAPTEGDRTESIEPRPWPHQIVGLPPHPSITFGHLPNGLRYAWRPFGDPAGEVYVWLHVAVGSLAESDGERGMAHFVEHMGFWGGGRFAKGQMIRWAQYQGLAFGPDLNAITRHDRTAYLIHLQRNDDGHITEALHVLREFVDGATLDEDAVRVEKGVVDAEERERESPAEAARRALSRFRLAGTMIPERNPLGVIADRQHFTRGQLLRFRDRHYGPRNLTLVVVGDLRGDPTELIEEVFADLKPRDLTPAPAIGVPTLDDELLVHRDQRLASVQITEERVVPATFVPMDAASRRARCPSWIAVRALDRRLAALTDLHPMKVEHASCSWVESEVTSPLSGVAFQVAAPVGEWREAYDAVVSEVRSALAYGFSTDEIDAIREVLLRELEVMSLRDASRLSGQKASTLLQAAGGGPGDLDPSAMSDLFVGPLGEVTAESAHASLVALFEAGRPLLSLVGPELADCATVEELRAVRDQAWGKKVNRREAAVVSRFAYDSSDAEPGKIRERRFDHSQDFHEIRFENGVRLWVRYQASKRIETRVLFGSGRSGIEGEAWDLPWSVSQLFSSLGLKAHTWTEWQRLMEGRDIGFDFQVGDAWLQLGGNSSLRDHRVQCELLASALDHTGFRDPELTRFVVNANQLIGSLFSEPEAVLSDGFWEALFAESGRQVYPEQAAIERLSMKDIREWIEPELRETPMDIVAWGGVDVDAVIDNVARTFGRLDPRPVESESVHRSSVTLRGGLRIVLEAPVSAPRAVIEVVYPIDEDLGVAERARLQLLERVIEDRLRRVTRERLAMAYSPSASSSSGRFMPGSAYIGVHLASDPREVDAALASSRAVLEAIVDGNRINIEELNRVRKPLLEERRDRYQLDILSELRVDAAAVWTDQRELACIQAATPDQVMEFARRVLIPDRASVGVVRPGSGKEDGG